MALKVRIYFGTILFAVTGLLCYWSKDNLSHEYFDFFGVLLGCIIIYLISYIIFQYVGPSGYWTNHTDKFIALIVIIGILVFGMNMSNKIDEEQPSFWVSNGNIWLTDLFGALIVLIVMYMMISWLMKQWKNIQTLKKDKSIAELALLKNQINPHFFFNTLNALFSLIKTNPDIAQDYVLKLSEMMRFTIYKGKDEYVALKDEIGYLKNFIGLQTARYHKTIEVEFNQNIQNPDTLVPPLMLIILLENAFKHGVENLVDHAFVHMDLFEKENVLTFEVKNNYDPEETPKEIGIGLKNLKDRLDLLFPKAYELSSSYSDDVHFAKLELRLK